MIYTVRTVDNATANQLQVDTFCCVLHGGVDGDSLRDYRTPRVRRFACVAGPPKTSPPSLFLVLRLCCCRRRPCCPMVHFIQYCLPSDASGYLASIHNNRHKSAIPSTTGWLTIVSNEDDAVPDRDGAEADVGSAKIALRETQGQWR